MKIKIISIVAIFIVLFTGQIDAQELQIGYNYSKFAPLGISIGYVYDVAGGYVSLKSGSATKSSSTQLYPLGQIVGTGNYKESGYNRGSYTAGVIVNLYKTLALYGGAGYGSYGEAWGEEDAEETALVINRFAGPEFEAGLMCRGEVYYIGAGVIFMNGTNVSNKAMLLDVSIQFGMIF